MVCDCCSEHSHAHEAENSLYVPKPATILETEMLTDIDRLFRIKLDSGEDLNHQPGQFVEISLMGIGEAPISVSSAPRQDHTFDLVIRKVGMLTDVLYEIEAGAKVGIRGPFGTSFPVDEMTGRDIIFVGGGCGLVPLKSAIEAVLARRNEFSSVTILSGCRNPSQRIFKENYQNWENREDVKFLETVDEGDSQWQGNTGVITTLFDYVEVDNPNQFTCVIVGPPVMYKFVIQKAKELGIKDEEIILSLERRMKCGVGKCGHCQINGIYVCQDGPVFRYSQVKELEEAL